MNFISVSVSEPAPFQGRGEVHLGGADPEELADVADVFLFDDVEVENLEVLGVDPGTQSFESRAHQVLLPFEVPEPLQFSRHGELGARRRALGLWRRRDRERGTGDAVAVFAGDTGNNAVFVEPAPQDCFHSDTPLGADGTFVRQVATSTDEPIYRPLVQGDVTSSASSPLQAFMTIRVPADKYQAYHVHPQHGSGPISIGGNNSSALRGSIAHIAIWNRLLSRAEIDRLWTAGQSELRDTPMYHSYV